WHFDSTRSISERCKKRPEMYMIPFHAPFAYAFTSCSQVVEHRSVIWPLVFTWLVAPRFWGVCIPVSHRGGHDWCQMFFAGQQIFQDAVLFVVRAVGKSSC